MQRSGAAAAGWTGEVQQLNEAAAADEMQHQLLATANCVCVQHHWPL
jgi:hypothetical protein